MPTRPDRPLDPTINVVSSLTIEELTGRTGMKPRKLVLLGPALPFKGAEWGSQLVMKTTWYPGNPADATQQVLVPADLPSAWEGVWRRTTMNRAPSTYVDETGEQSFIVEPHILREVLEDIHRRAALLRVTWAVTGAVMVGDPRSGTQRATDVKIVRVGRIQSFATPIDMHTDIRWRATFEWKGRGAEAAKVANVNGTSDANAAANALEASVLASSNAAQSRIIQSNFNVRKSANTLTLGQLESIANLPKKAIENLTRQLTSAMNDIRRAGNVIRTAAVAPVTAYNTMIDFARNTTAIANQFIDDMGRVPPELMSNKAKVRDLMRAANYTAGMVDAARVNADKAFDLVQAVKRSKIAGANRTAIPTADNAREGDILAVHVCKAGDTPTKLSQLYFKNPDQGAAILRANRMPWHTPSFQPGQIIVITKLDNRPVGI